LWEGTTDSAGNISGALALVSGVSTSVDFVVTATSNRYSPYEHTYNISCGSNSLGTISLTAATGYVCTTLCPLPLASTLQLSDPVIGTTTLTYSSGLWSGSVVYSYPGCIYTNGTGNHIICPPAPVTVHYGFNSFSSLSVSFKQVSATACPTDSGLGIANVFPAGTSHTCPTSFVAVFTLSVTGAQTAWPLWCLGSVTLTLTE